MTEHTRIPLPGDGENEPAKGSLLERVSDKFGLDPFRPAPVPAGLSASPVSRVAQAPRPATVAIQPSDAAAPASPPADSPESAKVIPATVEQAVQFTGPRHAIDRERLAARGIIVPEEGPTGLLEEFRIVKRQVIAAAHAAGDAAARRVLVCSPHPGEGKTFCAVNLAIAMAGERDGEVLLVDADFAKPSVLNTLGLPKAPGLMDALADPSIRVEDLVMATDIRGLFVLPAGGQTTADSEFLASARTAEVLDRLTRGAPDRMVVFDSPPALAASPAAELAKYVGQALLVARADRTGRSALEDAIGLLGACPDIKLLLNAAHFSPSGRTFGAYYGQEG